MGFSLMPVERSTLLIRARSFARVALLCLAAGGAQAGLFDDEEARKAILDLRARIQASEDAGRARLGDVKQAQTVQLEQLQEQLRDQTQQLRRGMLDISTQLDLERADNAKLRGTQEQLARDLAEVESLACRHRGTAFFCEDPAAGLDATQLKLAQMNINSFVSRISPRPLGSGNTEGGAVGQGVREAA